MAETTETTEPGNPLASLIDQLKAEAAEQKNEIVVEFAEDLDRATAFEVTDEGKASWVLGKLLAYDDEEKRLAIQFDVMRKAVAKRRANFAEHFLPMLADFFPVPAKGPKFLDLPAGRLRWRRTASTIDVRDKAALVEHLKAAGSEFITTHTPAPIDKLDLAAFKRAQATIVEAAIDAAAEDLPTDLEQVDADRAIDEAIAAALPPGARYRPEADGFGYAAPKA